MPFLSKQKTLHWTFHARAKMRFYRLSEQRVRQVLHSPKRIEEGVAPKTVAMMQPVSVTHRSVNETVPSGAQRNRGTPSHSAGLGKREETWNQEIWVMVQQTRMNMDGTRTHTDRPRQSVSSPHRSVTVTKVISAWRYPGRTKPRSPAAVEAIKNAYNEYMKTNK